MIDGNISMEEDTELKDLVVQALENNGVLAKVRAELRASVFLALEEQESVENPEPLLNKTVKQYLSNSEGKLLFSLVREFLEYFGLDYTISVYDPETYIGKEWNYMGRKKLSEKLGIRTTEPLLGELLKNSLNGAFNNSQQNDSTDSRLNKTNETSAINNATFEVSVPKLVHKESFSNDNDSSQKDDTVSSEISQEIPINVTITDKKQNENQNPSTNALIDTSSCEIRHDDLSKIEEGDETGNNNTKISDNDDDTCDNAANLSLNKTEQLIKFDDTLETNRNEDLGKNKLANNVDLHNTNNAQNRRITGVDNNFGKTVYFEEIIVDGKKEKVDVGKKGESLLGDLPPIAGKGNSIFGDLPPLNGKKTNINDLKELMDIGLTTSDHDHHYEEDFASSASGSANEASPEKNPDPESPTKQNQKDEKTNSARSEEISEEIDDIEEVLSANVSCVSDPIVI